MNRKELCRQLAAKLAEGEVQEAFRWLQLLDFAPSARQEEIFSAPAETLGDSQNGSREGYQPISIWRPQQIEDKWVFERPEPDPLGDHYASTRSWNAEKEPGTKRICFFGESVAAGYLYAPHITPAQVLERFLGERTSGRGYEVVDLARTNETLVGLQRVVHESLQLEPDALVIFAGNNWNLLETAEVSPYLPSVRGRQQYGEALQRGGASAIAALGRRKLREKASQVLRTIGSWARNREIPVVWVLPEVNLAHWQSRQPVVWLPNDGSRRWHDLYRQADLALRAQEWETAEAAARQMLGLDSGECSSSHRLLAQALIGQGRCEEAILACRGEVDAESYATLCFLGSPRANSLVREVVEAAVQLDGFTLVDLPEIFRRDGRSLEVEVEAEGGRREASCCQIPGRRLFLDYCHLTLEGIDLAMSSVAHTVHRLLSSSSPSKGELQGGHIAEQRRGNETGTDRAIPTVVKAEVRALAALGAAVHSAHRLLPVTPKSEFLEPWCREAFLASPGVVEGFLSLVQARKANAPAVLSEAHLRNLQSLYPLSLQHGWKWGYLDVDLLEAIENTLKEVDAEEFVELKSGSWKAHFLGHSFTDLSKAPFLWEPLARFYPDVMPSSERTGHGTLRSPWPSIAFCLVTTGKEAVDLEIEVRLPAIPGMDEPRTGTVFLEINGTRVGAWEVSQGWKVLRCTLCVEVFAEGCNKLSLHWPPLPAAGDLALTEAVRRLRLGQQADIHPVFGEVFRLSARSRGQALPG